MKSLENRHEALLGIARRHLVQNYRQQPVILARGDKIGLNDVMPRHLRLGGESSAAVTIPVGASMAEGRRRMFLQTLASTGGDQHPSRCEPRCGDGHQVHSMDACTTTSARRDRQTSCHPFSPPFLGQSVRVTGLLKVTGFSLSLLT